MKATSINHSGYTAAKDATFGQNLFFSLSYLQLGLTHPAARRYMAMQHTTTHCNTLPHTATHYHTPQHTATRGNASSECLLDWAIAEIHV